MNRRDFLRRTGATTTGLALFGRGRALAQTGPAPTWRAFEITTQVNVLHPRGDVRVWLPAPLAVAPYQRTMGDTYHSGGGTAVMIETNANEPDVLGCSWDEGIDPVLTLVSRVSTATHAVNLETPTVPPPLDFSGFARFLKPTKLIPLDAGVKAKADAIARGAGTDIERARALYDSVINDPSRDGSSVDQAALFVGLCRVSGIPARSVYGLLVAADDATKAQRCRAEVYLTGFGWVPVDLAGTRFGSWDADWVAYNFAHDVDLRGSSRKALAYFMYPQGEMESGPLDSLDADRFKYAISVRAI